MTSHLSSEMGDAEFLRTREMCADLCAELMVEIKKDEILHVITEVVTKCEHFSTRATVAEPVITKFSGCPLLRDLQLRHSVSMLIYFLRLTDFLLRNDSWV